ncbi:MAG: DUF3341 domain-containing protein [Gemmatimonadaceae bacterium]
MAGVIGVFSEIDMAVQAIEALRRNGFKDITVYSPTPRHELEHAMEAPPSRVRLFTLIGGLAGAMFGYWIAIWSSRYWPMVVGGKAVASWVPYTIYGFEVMVLVGSLSTVFALFALSRLPRLTMTVGYDERFSAGHFGVWVAAPPDRVKEATELLRKHGAEEVRNEA